MRFSLNVKPSLHTFLRVEEDMNRLLASVILGYLDMTQAITERSVYHMSYAPDMDPAKVCKSNQHEHDVASMKEYRKAPCSLSVTTYSRHRTVREMAEIDKIYKDQIICMYIFKLLVQHH
jgi:hypothetical protein